MTEQLDFKAKHVTQHQLLRAPEYLKENLKVKKPFVATLLGIVKAFDEVWHYDLIYKLIWLNIPSGLIHYIHS